MSVYSSTIQFDSFYNSHNQNVLNLIAKKPATEAKHFDKVQSKLYLVLKDNDFIYGGYVRDFVINKQLPKDIDISIFRKENETRQQAVDTFIFQLVEIFGAANVNYDGSTLLTDCYNPIQDLKHKLVSVREDEDSPWVCLDLVLAENNDVFETIDVDLNCFRFGKQFFDSAICDAKQDLNNNLWVLTAAQQLDLDQLINNCRAKKLTILDPQISQKRLYTLETRGYTKGVDENDLGEDGLKKCREDLLSNLKKLVNENISQETKEREKTMSAKSVAGLGFMNMTKEDGKKAAWRVGAKQISDTTKNVIISLLTDKKMIKGKAQTKALMDILDSEFGTAAVQMGLGYLFTYMPMIKEDARAQKLAEEFRVSGMTTIGNEFMGALMGSFLPQVSNILSALPNDNEEEEEQKEVNVASSPFAKTA